MANHDEVILRSRRVWPDAPFPLLHQALRIALYDEYGARAFYARVLEAFGPQAPFANIVQSELRHVDALSDLCQRYGVPRPIDPFPAETAVAPSWRANLERAVSGEIANVQLYQHLLPHVTASDVRKVFVMLQADSLERHLPAFQRALESAVARERWHAQHGVAPSQAYVRHGPVTEVLERAFALLARQNVALGFFGSVVRATHPAMLAGMAAGAAAVHYLRKPAQSHLSRTKED
jgi:rubrerythrin